MHRHVRNQLRGKRQAKQRSDILADRQTDGGQMGEMGRKAKSQAVRETERQMAGLQGDRRMDRMTNGMQPVRQVWKLKRLGTDQTDDFNNV